MSDRVPPIARIRLSRSLPRLLFIPVLGLLVGLAAVAGGILLVPGIMGLAVAGLGAFIVVVTLVGVVVLLSIRLEIEEAAVCLAWMGGERIYPLSPGPVTRVRLRGQNASRLRAAPRLLPWQLGAGRLRDEEDIEVVRLAPTPTAILLPTERGRLAIAAADEEALLAALSRAARARQRLDELTRETPPVEVPEPPPLPQVEVHPALMTGIERAAFEDRRAEAQRAVAPGVATPEVATTVSVEPEAVEPRVVEPEVVEPEVVGPEAVEPQVVEPDVVQPTAKRRLLRLPRPHWAPRPGPSLALLILPLVGAGVAWGLAVLLDRMPEPATDIGRLTALALVLAGPATTVGAIMARVWWPRIVGVVVAGGLAAAVFVGRALLG